MTTLEACVRLLNRIHIAVEGNAIHRPPLGVVHVLVRMFEPSASRGRVTMSSQYAPALLRTVALSVQASGRSGNADAVQCPSLPPNELDRARRLAAIRTVLAP
jgi:hypothetical protein